MASSSSAEEDRAEDQTPPSAVAVAGNDDLLTSILLRLQPKPLIRLKSVSKHWLSLISHPKFSLLHTRRNPNPKPSAIFFYPESSDPAIEYQFISLNGDGAPPFRSLDFVHDPSGIHIQQSCSGLLICSSYCRTMDQLFNQMHYIYNPTTKQYSVIVPPNGGSPFSSIFTRVCLAFDPSKSPHYKLVLLREASGRNQYFEIHVYSSETMCWRRSGDDFEWPWFFMSSEGVFWNGAIVWASKNDSMCFDVDMECHRAMPTLPDFRDLEAASVRYFGESCGHLHIVDVQAFQVMKIDVYEMERDYSKWYPKYCIDLNGFVAGYPDVVWQLGEPLDDYGFSVVSLVRAENEDNSSLVLHIPGKVISYNFNEKSMKQLGESWPGEVYKRPSYRIRCFDGHRYFESLACI